MLWNMGGWGWASASMRWRSSSGGQPSPGATVPLLAPLVVVLRWIEGDEADKQAAADAQELKEREVEDQEGLRGRAGAAQGGDAGREGGFGRGYDRRVQGARAGGEAPRRGGCEAREAEDRARGLAAERWRSRCSSRRSRSSRSRCTRPASRGHRRDSSSTSSTRWGSHQPQRGDGPGAEVPKHLISRAAELLNLGSDELWSQLSPRLASYLDGAHRSPRGLRKAGRKGHADAPPQTGGAAAT